MMTPQEKAKDARLKREFHISLEEFNRILAYQGGGCAICKRTHSKKGKKLLLAVDHDHKTGEVRGIVCWPCNKGIAVFQDDWTRLQSAAIYFQQLPVEMALGSKRFTAPGRVGKAPRKKLLAAFNAAREGNEAKESRKKSRVGRKVQVRVR